MTYQAFTCRAKPDGKTDLCEQSLAENTLYYGLPDIPGLLDDDHTIESIKQAVRAVRAVHPEYIPLREAKMFWIFSRAMPIGAMVLTPRRIKDQTVYYIGEVTGKAHHLTDKAAQGATYGRPVHWHNGKQPLASAELPKGLAQKINVVYNATRTCLDISEFGVELRNRIRRGT